MSVSFITNYQITIASGQNASGWSTAKIHHHDAAALVIYSPAVLDALTFTFEVVGTEDGVGLTRTLVDASGTDMSIPGAGKARWYAELASVGSWRIKASGNVAANRVFDVTKHFTLAGN